MKKKILSVLSVIALMTIVGCTRVAPKKESSSEGVTSSSSSTSSSISSSEGSSSSSSSSSSQSSSSSSSEEEEGSWEDDKYFLECGFYNMGIPSNKDNPITIQTTLGADSSSWFNASFSTDVSEGYRYIYKNSCSDGPSGHKCSVQTYAESHHGGGLKITDPGTGFGSPMFTHEGAKLELRIGISSVNNASDKPVQGKDTFHIYFFDKNNNYLGKVVRAERTVETSTKEMKFYYTESNAKDVAFFEFRCNAKPYKSSQSYNVGISYCNVKSWERVL